MKIAIWKTGHDIADKIADAISEGLQLAIRYGKCSTDNCTTEISYTQNVIETPDVHVGYGILRGMDQVFKAATLAHRPFICVDRGYWKPGHFDGYYRVSLNGTQQTTGLDKLEPDYARLDHLFLSHNGHLSHTESKTLVCPPTYAVCQFFGINPWVPETNDVIWRGKSCARPLADDLARCTRVHTFNSSVGWHALSHDIQVVSDEKHSIVGAYQKIVAKDLHIDYNARRRFFGVQASLQLTLAEMKSGMIWPLMQKLLNAR